MPNRREVVLWEPFKWWWKQKGMGSEVSLTPLSTTLRKPWDICFLMATLSLGHVDPVAHGQSTQKTKLQTKSLKSSFLCPDKHKVKTVLRHMTFYTEYFNVKFNLASSRSKNTLKGSFPTTDPLAQFAWTVLRVESSEAKGKPWMTGIQVLS